MLEWRDTMSIDRGALDDDHHRLNELIRHFVALPGEEEQRPRAIALLERLRALAFRHFEQEERVQAAIRYPLLADHRSQHRRLVLLLDDIIAQVDERESAFAFGYAKEKADHLLPFWFLDHFTRGDLPLKTHLAKIPGLVCAPVR
ncbi:bacteriohemerythrin [Azospirillum agricola]|uniref:bacteriohemerythrin n=1 Tax=Azospirillum agricola TaxID=1720247 RepID=UPI000A0EFAFC|nr:hemerythrin family protein [Azospirillum agricola]MBP2226817.1 hemerythrin-like metal-binding protein [Azospirillum agricola]SMH58424.1 hemerythrin-like metal-binding domain protein [Azospirillum lipoferum]